MKTQFLRTRKYKRLAESVDNTVNQASAVGPKRAVQTFNPAALKSANFGANASPDTIRTGGRGMGAGKAPVMSTAKASTEKFGKNVDMVKKKKKNQPKFLKTRQYA